MLAVIFLIGSVLLGIEVVKQLFPFTNKSERLFWGIALGPMLTIWTAYLISHAVGNLNYATLSILTVVVWALIIAEWWRSWPRFRFSIPAIEQISSVKFEIILALIFGIIFGYFFYEGMFHPRPDGFYLTATSWYDMALHSAIATSFAYGQNFPPANIYLSGEPLLYPFLPDFHAAILLKLGWGLWPSFAITAWLMAMSLVGIFHSFARRLIESAGASFLATLFFFFSGGLGFALLFNDWRSSGQSFFHFVWNMKENYTDIWSRGIKFMNLITSGLIPERAYLYGLPLSFIILTLLAIVWKNWSTSKSGEKWDQHRTLIGAGVITGLLPTFYSHAYAIVGFISCVLFILRPRRAWLAFWIPALLLGLPQILQLGHHLASGTFLRFHFGWVSYTYPNFFLFLLRNFGLSLVLIFPAFFLAPNYLKTFYLPFVALMIFSFLFIISPNDIDNIKLIYYWYGATGAMVSAWLVGLNSRVWLRVLAGALLLCCIASGALAIVRESKLVWRIFSPEEIEAGDFARDKLPPKELFLTGQNSNQPVLCLAGKPILLGYDFWVTSHGYSRARYNSMLSDVKRIYGGGAPGDALLKKYGVKYVYLGPNERRELRANASYFDQHYRRVFQNSEISIYDCSAPPG